MRHAAALALIATVAGCVDPAAEQAKQNARIFIIGEALYAYNYCYRSIHHGEHCPETLAGTVRDRAAYIARYGSDPLAR